MVGNRTLVHDFYIFFQTSSKMISFYFLYSILSSRTIKKLNSSKVNSSKDISKIQINRSSKIQFDLPSGNRLNSSKVLGLTVKWVVSQLQSKVR